MSHMNTMYYFSIGSRHLGDGGVAEFHYSKKYKLGPVFIVRSYFKIVLSNVLRR